MKVLVIQTAFIGDAILASSMLEALQAIPEVSQVSIMVRKGNHGLYRDHPFIHRLHVLDKSLSKWQQLRSMIRELRQESYDVVINLQRFATTGIITWRSGAKVKIGYAKNPLSWSFDHAIQHEIGDGRHEVDRYMDLLSPLFGECSAKPKLYPTASDYAKVNRERPYVCLAPKSVWQTKQWPQASWVELAQRIPEEMDVLLIGAASDLEFCSEIAQQSGRMKVYNLCGELDLLQSAALMKGARMNYVNDSAPLHLCTALNSPVTAFFCSTIPDFGFGPLSDDAETVETEEELTCRPCGLHGKRACPEGHFKCGNYAPAQVRLPEA